MIFDAHFHIIDTRFPLIENKGFLPEPFTVSNYKQKVNGLHFRGGAIVAGSFQHGYQDFLINAIAELGKNYVGVTTFSQEMTDSHIIQLDTQGMRALRINLYRGQKQDLDQVVTLAKRLYDLVGWHIELYVENESLETLIPYIKQMPKVSIDHLGLTSNGLNHLYHLVDHGVYVKATGFMRVDFAPLPVMQHIIDINPNALMFGTDLPGTRAKRQFNQGDISLINEGFSPTICKQIFYENALKFYRI